MRMKVQRCHHRLPPTTREKKKETKIQEEEKEGKPKKKGCDDENMMTDWITLRATSARGGLSEGYHVWYVTIKNLASSSVAVGVTTRDTKSLVSMCLGDDDYSWALHSDLSLWYV